MHFCAGHAGKHLHRPGEVELGHSGEYHKTNLKRFGHDDLSKLRGISTATSLVVAGLDPAIHLLRKTLFEA
jgi:hypothetical protein